VAQHDKLRIDDANHKLADGRIEQDQVHHPINDLQTSLIDGCQLCQVFYHAQPYKVAQGVRVDKNKGVVQVERQD
jgi:hypothetical protein